MRNDPTYTVVKKYLGLIVHQTSTVMETFTTQGVTLSAFSGYADYTAAFDQFCIQELEYEYLPRLPINDGNAIVNTGVFVSVVDTDDSTVLASVNEALEYPGAKVFTATPSKTNQLVHRFKPRAALAAYQGAFTGYASSSAGNQWIDCNSAGVVHYGVKTAATLTSAVCTYDLMITAKISFRGSR